MTNDEIDNQTSHEKNCLKTFLVMERADDGPLKDRLRCLSELQPCQNGKGFTAILLCLLDVACGLEFLHSVGVTYGMLHAPLLLEIVKPLYCLC